MAESGFDVFLSHNSRDKPAVLRLAEALQGRRLRPWLDIWHLPPGQPWMDEIEKAIVTIPSALVLVGGDGLGPWEVPEMRGCLQRSVSREMRVVPVLLPGAPLQPELPLFLGQLTWVDLRDGLTDEGLDRLEWGISGVNPKDREKKARLPLLRNLPFEPLGDLFQGREQDLQDLARDLEGDGRAAIVPRRAIHGLGGIGKTRLAVEYAYRSGDRYSALFFVRADTPEGLRAQLASLAGPELLNLPERQQANEGEVVGAVIRWLREHPGWLSIFDNVDSPEAAAAVKELLPKLTGGQILITSRLASWPAGIRARLLEVFPKEEAARFLLERTEGRRALAVGEREVAGQLAEALGGLPLALEQAAAYVAHLGISLAAYWKAWEEEREKVLGWHDGQLMDYPVSVAVTWQQSFTRLSVEAAALLRLASFLAPEPIQLAMFEEERKWFEEGVAALGGELEQVASGLTPMEALAELVSFSLATRKGGDFSVHRLVQQVVRGCVPEKWRKTWLDRALELVISYMPLEPTDVRTWSVWDHLRPHAAWIALSADSEGITEPAAYLMVGLAKLLMTKGASLEAEAFYRRSLAIREAAGSEGTELGVCLNDLAWLLMEMNRLEEAEPLLQRALSVAEACYGPAHPDVASVLGNLVGLLLATNRLEEAEPLMWRALAIDESLFGLSHPNVARDLINLGTLFTATKRLSEAETLMRRALSIDETFYGPSHPEVATDLDNLAWVLSWTNRLAEALPLMERALDIRTRWLGSDHPYTRKSRESLETFRAAAPSPQPSPAERAERERTPRPDPEAG